jgi:hypothetical protein
VIVFPDVGAQDTLVYTIKHTRKAPFPVGSFSAEYFFAGSHSKMRGSISPCRAR